MPLVQDWLCSQNTAKFFQPDFTSSLSHSPKTSPLWTTKDIKLSLSINRPSLRRKLIHVLRGIKGHLKFNLSNSIEFLLSKTIQLQTASDKCHFFHPPSHRIIILLTRAWSKQYFSRTPSSLYNYIPRFCQTDPWFQ